MFTIFAYLKVTTDIFEGTFNSNEGTVTSDRVNMLLHCFSYYTSLTAHATVYGKLVAD